MAMIDPLGDGSADLLKPLAAVEGEPFRIVCLDLEPHHVAGAVSCDRFREQPLTDATALAVRPHIEARDDHDRRPSGVDGRMADNRAIVLGDEEGSVGDR